MTLVNTLQTGEIRLLRHFYRLHKDNESKKINLLFDLAIRSKTCKKTEELNLKAMKLLYKGNSKYEYTFARLKSRLKNDILNILLLQAFSMKLKSRHDSAIFDCRRMLIQGEILMNRGIYAEGISILEKASTIARKNELFAEQILIDELCRNYNLAQSGEKEFRNFMSRIEKNTGLLERAQYAKYFHYEITAARLFKKSLNPLEDWKNKLDKIRKDYEESRSVKIGFYYHLSALNYYREARDYKRSLEFGIVMLKDSETNEILKTPYYLGRINMELAKCYLLTGDYERAIQHTDTAGQHLGKELDNQLALLEILFHAHVMKNDSNKVKAILHKAFEKTGPSEHEQLRAKWHFLKAGAEFRSGEFSNALQSLRSCDVLLRDKNGWLLAYSLFEAICKIENGNLEWMEYRSEALKKIMQRYNKEYEGDQKVRYDCIYRILRTLHKNSYDYVQTLNDEEDTIRCLSATSYEHSWHLSGYEPVPFESWIRKKAAAQLKSKKKPRLVA